MKKTFFLFLVSLTSLSLVSCHSDEDREDGPGIEIPAAWYSSTRGAFLTTCHDINSRKFSVPSCGFSDTLSICNFYIDHVSIFYIPYEQMNLAALRGCPEDVVLDWYGLCNKEHLGNLYGDIDEGFKKLESEYLDAELMPDGHTLVVKVKENNTGEPRFFNIDVSDSAIRFRANLCYIQEPGNPSQAE